METVIAGSYDRFLFGFQCSTSGPENVPESLVRSFTYPAHKGPVKCIDSSAPYIASGGADDLIHLYDLKSESDLGFLVSPGNGAVSAVAWHKQNETHHPTHLFSGAADGSISVWQAGGDWVCLKTLHSHKKEVTSLAIHQSGRLGLSTSRDDSMKLWNLVKGKCVHTTKLASSADQVKFEPQNSKYALVIDKEVSVYSTDSGENSLLSLLHPRKVQCISYTDNQTLLTGSEEGTVRVWDLRQPNEASLTIPNAHKSRVRGLTSLGSKENHSNIFISASSDGGIKSWDLRVLKASSSGGSKPLAQAETRARLTCLTSIDLSKDVKPVKHTKGLKKSKISSEPQKLSSKALSEKQKQDTKKTLDKRKEKKRDIDGVVHNGVVDFLDTEEEPAQKKKASLSGRKKKSKLS